MVIGEMRKTANMTEQETIEEWLNRLVTKINKREIYSIKDYSNSITQITIENESAQQYEAVAEVNGRIEKIIILAQPKQNRIVVLRKFILDCDYINGLFDAVRMLDAGKLQSKSFVKAMDYADYVAYFPEYVCTQEYHFGADWKYKKIVVAVRNPIGGLSCGKYGEFLPMKKWQEC